MTNRNFLRTPLLASAIALTISLVPALADDPYSGSPGSLDLHFGEWGLGLATSANVGEGYATAIGTDSMGRIVVGGDTCIDDYCGPVLSDSMQTVGWIHPETGAKTVRFSSVMTRCRFKITRRCS